MTEIFRPIDGSIVFPDRVPLGKPWGNISFGANATAATYQDKGLYLEVGAEPAYGADEEAVIMTEVIDHVGKEVTVTWAVQPFPDPLASKTMAEVEAWVDEIDANDSVKDAIMYLARAIKAIP